MKTVLIFTLLGALLGVAAASVVVPPALGWYNEAGYLSQPRSGTAQAPQSLVNVPELIRYTTSRLIRGQVIGGAVGAAAFLVIGVLVARRGARRSAPSANAPASRPAG